jgi:putative endonuclease
MRMNSPKQPAVYILASKRNGTLYTGVTSDLVKRIWQHRNSVVDGFTQKYSVHSLVYYELAEEMAGVIYMTTYLASARSSGLLRLRLAMTAHLVIASNAKQSRMRTELMACGSLRPSVPRIDSSSQRFLGARSSGLLRLRLAMTAVRRPS